MSELKRKEGQPWPTRRDAHATCSLGFGSDNPQLLIIGGIDPYDDAIGDAWIFDFSSQTWRKVYINTLRVYGHRFVCMLIALLYTVVSWASAHSRVSTHVPHFKGIL